MPVRTTAQEDQGRGGEAISSCVSSSLCARLDDRRKFADRTLSGAYKILKKFLIGYTRSGFVTLDEEITGFLQQGLAIHIGTRNERLEPNGAPLSPCAVDDDGSNRRLHSNDCGAAGASTTSRPTGRAQ